jgi:hypothetical protein
MDNGKFTLGAPRADGEQPAPEEVGLEGSRAIIVICNSEFIVRDKRW